VRFHAGNKLSVNVDRADVVDQHADTQAVTSIENAIEQGRFPGAEESGQKCNWNGIATWYDEGFCARRGGEYRNSIFTHDYSRDK
jgi:hypothetical protein